MSESSRIALVLGATGGIGGETALALSRRGWKIRAFSGTAKPADSSGWEWVKGDALERASGATTEPHPVTELDVIWNRFVGIVLGVIAMRLAFAFPSITFRSESSDLDAHALHVDADHGKAS